MRRTLVAALLVSGLVVSGCGGDGAATRQASHYVVNVLQARNEAAGRGPSWFKTLDELLPNTAYQHPTGQRETLTDLVVIGHIVEVEKGIGFVVPGGDAPSGQPTSFDDPKALWRTVHFRVDVDQTAGGSQRPRSVQVGLAFGVDSDFAKIAAGLQGLGRVVLFLQKNSPVLAYDSSLYSVVEDGNLIATVGADGTLALPILDSERASQLLSTTPRLDRLIEKGRAVNRTLMLQTRDGVAAREQG